MDWETKELLERATRELEAIRAQQKRTEEELCRVAEVFRKIEQQLRSKPLLATSISFKENL